VPGTMCRVAGTGVQGYNGDGKLATMTDLNLPTQVRRGPDGLLYIMDFNNHMLRRIEANGMISTVAGNGLHGGATPDVPAIESPLENPIDFDFMPDGRIVLVSYHDPRVLVIDEDGVIRVLAGSIEGGERGNEGDGGPPLFARFIEVHGIAIAPDGSIYIADHEANRIRVIRGGADGTIDTFAGAGGTGSYTGDGGPATAATFHEPSAIAIDGEGSVYVADGFNCVIRKITSDGIIKTVAGTGPNGEFSHPEGVAVAADGTLYIGDRFHSVVQRVSPDGTLETIAGTGTRGTTGDGGPALEAELGYVSRVQLDTDGSLLISDQTNDAIRRLVMQP